MIYVNTGPQASERGLPLCQCGREMMVVRHDARGRRSWACPEAVVRPFAEDELHDRLIPADETA